MLYALYQTAADLMLPMRLASAVAGRGFALGGNAGAERWRAASALCEMMSRAALSHRRPAFGIQEVKSGNRIVPVIDGLQSLVEKNLVRREPGADGEPRFMMLETIREFALDELCARGELDEALRRHAEYYLTWLSKGDPRQLAARPRGWMRRLDFDYGNLRAAVGW